MARVAERDLQSRGTAGGQANPKLRRPPMFFPLTYPAFYDCRGENSTPWNMAITLQQSAGESGEALPPHLLMCGIDL